jgi:hypothetical protein
MQIDLSTTNTLLGVMAGVSLVQAILLVVAGIAGFRMYSRLTTLVDTLETRHVAPAMARVNSLIDVTQKGVHSVLDDVKGVTMTIKDETDRVDRALHQTADRVDHTVSRLRGNVRAKAIRVGGLMRGVRVMIETLQSGDRQRTPHAIEHIR